MDEANDHNNAPAITTTYLTIPIVEEPVGVTQATGSPKTFGCPRSLKWLDQEIELKDRWMGLAADELSQLVGSPVDVLLGTDLLGKVPFRIAAGNTRLEINPEPPHPDIERVPLRQMMGVPMIRVVVDGRSRVNVFMDTGAKLSHLRPSDMGDRDPVGRQTDYSPSFRVPQFETDVWHVPIELAGQSVSVPVGSLPEVLAMALTFGGADGVLGTSVFEYFDVYFNLPEAWLAFEPRG